MYSFEYRPSVNNIVRFANVVLPEGNDVRQLGALFLTATLCFLDIDAVLPSYQVYSLVQIIDAVWYDDDVALAMHSLTHNIIFVTCREPLLLPVLWRRVFCFLSQ